MFRIPEKVGGVLRIEVPAAAFYMDPAQRNLNQGKIPVVVKLLKRTPTGSVMQLAGVRPITSKPKE